MQQMKKGLAREAVVPSEGIAVAPDDRSQNGGQRATIEPQVEDDTAPRGYYRLLRDIAAWMPRNSVLSAEAAGTMDIDLTQLRETLSRGPARDSSSNHPAFIRVSSWRC
jgi:hypothetical protein